MLTTGTAAFATITSLLAAFKTDRSAAQQDDFDEFIAWLTEKNHNQVVELLTQNQATSISIKAILNQNHGKLIEQLKSLEATMLSIAINSPTFQRLAKALNPEASELSTQAKNLLKFLHQHATAEVYLNAPLSGKFDSAGLPYFPTEIITEPTFLFEDCELLIKQGYLSSNKSNWYKVTRLGSSFAQSLLDAESDEI